jgi:hypothetical protein
MKYIEIIFSNKISLFIAISFLFSLNLYLGEYEIYISNGDFLLRPDINIWLNKIDSFITNQGFGQINTFIVSKIYYQYLKLFYNISAKFAFSFAHYFVFLFICLCLSYYFFRELISDDIKALLFALLYSICPVALYLINIPEPFAISYITTPGIFLFIIRFFKTSKYLNLGLLFCVGFSQTIGYSNPGFIIANYFSLFTLFIFLYFSKIKNYDILRNYLYCLFIIVISQIYNSIYSIVSLLEIRFNIIHTNTLADILRWTKDSAYYTYSIIFFKQEFIMMFYFKKMILKLL